MLITKKFLDDVGRRSPMAREAMVQAGDKNRVKALKNFLVSIGSCEITHEDARNLNLPVFKKKYSFSSTHLIYVLLPPPVFARFKRLANSIDLEIAHIRNGLIGIQGEYKNA